jgi:hypothetical protein
MFKSDMTCSSCIFGEPAGNFGSIRCIRYPESIMKRPDEFCGEGRFYEEDCFALSMWGEWERESPELIGKTQAFQERFDKWADGMRKQESRSKDQC